MSCLRPSWTSEKLTFAFDSNLRIYSTIEELNSDIPADVPKTILTVPSTLSHGFSRSLFIDFAKSPNNVVVLTGMSDDGTLARWLWSHWNEKQPEGEKWGAGKVGSVVQMDETIPLEVSRSLSLLNCLLTYAHTTDETQGLPRR